MNEENPSAAPYTVAPVRSVEADDPKFVDYKGLAAIFGIKRSLAYQLLAEGKTRASRFVAGGKRAENGSSSSIPYAPS